MATIVALLLFALAPSAWGLIRDADRGHVAIVKRLLETDIEVDHVNRLGWTALLKAIILGGRRRALAER